MNRSDHRDCTEQETGKNQRQRKHAWASHASRVFDRPVLDGAVSTRNLEDEHSLNEGADPSTGEQRGDCETCTDLRSATQQALIGTPGAETNRRGQECCEKNCDHVAC